MSGGAGSSRGPGLRFVATFGALAGVGLAVYFFPYEQGGIDSGRFFTPYLSAYARMTAGVLRLFDSGVVVTGSTIAGRFAMQIVRSCDAMEVNILFAAAVVAFPAPWARRAIVLVGGLVGLVAINVTRLCTLYFVGIHAPAHFEQLHYEVWPLVLVVVETALFVVSARWMADGAQRDTAGGTVDARG